MQHYVKASMQLHASVVLEIFIEEKHNMTDSNCPGTLHGVLRKHFAGGR